MIFIGQYLCITLPHVGLFLHFFFIPIQTHSFILKLIFPRRLKIVALVLFHSSKSQAWCSVPCFPQKQKEILHLIFDEFPVDKSIRTDWLNKT